MRPASLLAVSVATLVAWTSGVAEETADPAPAVDSAAMKSMGYAMASQLRLNIGFSDEELEKLFEGMRMAAKGEGEPENFTEAISQAQQIYMTRMQAFQLKEQQKAEELADKNEEEAAAFFASLEEKEGIRKTDSGLYYEVLVEGEGDSPGENDNVVVNYKGVLIDGREFDANENATFRVDRVVPGFGQGLQLLKKGGKAKLYIPSNLGYGRDPARPGSIIEPGDALIFEVELLDFTAAPKPQMGTPPSLPPNMTPPPPPPSGPPPGPPPPPPPNMKPPSQSPGKPKPQG